MLPSEISSDRFLRRAQVRFGNDFQQWCASTIEINTRRPVQTLVDRLARIFLQMRASDADTLVVAVGILNIQFAVLDDRQFVLADLVTLGQVRIEVILARKHRALSNSSVYGQTELAGHAYDFLV